jgi:hypothetical protein
MAGSGEGQGGAITRAVIRPVTDATGATMPPSARSAEAVTVHFNPEKLDITLTNNLRPGAGSNPAQLTDEAKAQLSVDLVFDTTITGSDVRGVTDSIARFLKPTSGAGASPEQKAPPPRVVEFDWGAILFQGYIDRYSESLDFFSHDGVPLRATVSLSLTQQERTFAPRQAAGGGGFAAGGVGADPFGGGGFELSIGLDLPIGNAVASFNGLENARLPGVAAVSISAGGSLGLAAATFAQAGAGFGISAGVSGGIGAGAGVGIGTGGGIGIGGGASFGASAGAGGTAAAFSGLSVKPPKLEIGASSASGGLAAVTVTTGPVRLGGKLEASAGASLSADVGARGGIRFGGV